MGIGEWFRSRTAAALLGVTLAFTSTACISAHPGDKKPRAEIFDQEIVHIDVNYRAETLVIEPESVTIYLQWDYDRQDPLRPVQVRWVVDGLKRGHTLYIFPKKEAPEVVFPFSDEYQGRPAFSIDGENNSIRSGEPHAIPGLTKGKGYDKERRGKYDEPVVAKWRYDVAVVDENGEELFRVDPQIVVHGHP